MNLVDQRCTNHALREAAVQCPSCTRFFCRECVTEYQGRMMCVSCVTGRVEAQPRARFKVRWTVMAGGGVVLAWLLFYYLGLTLSRIPSEFHAEPESFVRPGEPQPLAGASCGAGYQPAACFQQAFRRWKEKPPGGRLPADSPPHMHTGAILT